MYKKEFTLNSFSFLTGIDELTINRWSEGKQIPDYADSNIPSNIWCIFAKKVKSNSEKALHDSMLNGNLMAYATLKCWYGWQETPQAQVIQVSAPAQNAATIAQKYSTTSIAPPVITTQIPTNANTETTQNN